MELQKLIFYNEWWKTGSVPEELLKPHKRFLFNEIIDYFDDKQILSIIGLRRTGKTTILYQLIDYLLYNKINSKNILYFSFDDFTSQIEDLLETYREHLLEKNWRQAGRIYVFFDEIQKNKSWENILKKYYDLYPNLKFIISGSAGLDIDKKTKETLVGRIYDFKLNPLTFKEFIIFKNYKLPKLSAEFSFFKPVSSFLKTAYNKLSVYASDIRLFLNEYLKKGGFPEIIAEMNPEKIKKYIHSSVIEKVIYQDIPRIFRIDEPELLYSILKIISDNPGMLVEYLSFANNLKRNRKTIANYFFYLQKSFLITMLANYKGSQLTSARKSKKIYLTDTGVINSLYERDFSDSSFMGKIIENTVINHLNPNLFWKNNGNEIDIIVVKDKKVIPVEIKYRENIDKNDLKSINVFMNKYKQKTGIIVTKNTFEIKKKENMELYFIPAWFLLTLLK